jgi:hypothetical protein
MAASKEHIADDIAEKVCKTLKPSLNELEIVIAEKVCKTLKPSFNELLEIVKAKAVDMEGMELRLAALENLLPSDTGTKRAVKTVDEVPKKKATPPKIEKPGGTRAPNAMVKFKNGIRDNTNDYRKNYFEPIKDTVEKNPIVASKDKEKDPKGYWNAVADFLWKNMSQTQRDTIKNDKAANGQKPAEQLTEENE